MGLDERRRRGGGQACPWADGGSKPPELFNGLGGDGAWRPRARRGRTRQAPGSDRDGADRRWGPPSESGAPGRTHVSTTSCWRIAFRSVPPEPAGGRLVPLGRCIVEAAGRGAPRRPTAPAPSTDAELQRRACNPGPSSGSRWPLPGRGPCSRSARCRATSGAARGVARRGSPVAFLEVLPANFIDDSHFTAPAGSRLDWQDGQTGGVGAARPGGRHRFRRCQRPAPIRLPSTSTGG